MTAKLNILPQPRTNLVKFTKFWHPKFTSIIYQFTSMLLLSQLYFQIASLPSFTIFFHISLFGSSIMFLPDLLWLRSSKNLQACQFPIINFMVMIICKQEGVFIWTTNPWTILCEVINNYCNIIANDIMMVIKAIKEKFLW